MANITISALSAAGPINPNVDVLPIVNEGITKKVNVTTLLASVSAVTLTGEYLPLSGGTVTGEVLIQGNNLSVDGIISTPTQFLSAGIDVLELVTQGAQPFVDSVLTTLSLSSNWETAYQALSAQAYYVYEPGILDAIVPLAGSNNAVTNNSVIGGGCCNTVNGSYGIVSGGKNNNASGPFSNINGGCGNTASGFYSSIGGGADNQATAFHSHVGGGLLNAANAEVATVVGGKQNTASGFYSTVAGGGVNTASGNYSNVNGGYRNRAKGSYSNVAGGAFNKLEGEYSAIAGGQFNSITGNNVFVLGSNISSANVDDYTFVNNLSSTGLIHASLDISTTGRILSAGYDIGTLFNTGGGGGGGTDTNSLPLSGGTMSGPIYFGSPYGSRIDQGIYDSSRGGLSGISLVCSVHYDFNWQAGWITALEQDRLTPRPLYIDSGVGTTLKIWDNSSYPGSGIEISHNQIIFKDNSIQDTAFTTTEKDNLQSLYNTINSISSFVYYNSGGQIDGDVSITGTFSQGNLTVASGCYSYAGGQYTTASGYASHAEGNCAIACGDASHAEGGSTIASGIASHAEGGGSIACGDASHAEGSLANASGCASHAEGVCTIASAYASHAEGMCTVASGCISHAEGFGTNACGLRSHAEGCGTTAFGDSSHAEGLYSAACGNYSHAEGSSTACGYYSHSEGFTTTACGAGSHAEGKETTASGCFSHAEGFGTTSSGYGSHAAGIKAIAAHDRSWIWRGSTLDYSTSTTKTDQFMVSAQNGSAFFGNVGINTDDNTHALNVSGNISTSGQILSAGVDISTLFLYTNGGFINGNVTLNNNLTVFGNLSTVGTSTFANTVYTTTTALSVVHYGSGPALYIGNYGSGDIASFYDIDQNIEVLHVGGINSSYPNVGIHTSTPNKTFTINGEISANNTAFFKNVSAGNISISDASVRTFTNPVTASGEFLVLTIKGVNRAIRLWDFTS
jgi:hypothetical protein